jgi:DNA-binding transcriptional LysR family regulator
VTDSFQLAHVPGVMPAKWVRIWAERVPAVPLVLTQTPAADAAGLVREREVDAALLRLPVDRDELHAIPLYTETTVIVVPKEHSFGDTVHAEDVAGETLLHPLDDVLDWAGPPGRPALDRPATTKDAVELVAAGVGLLVVPQSLARLHHRRDLTYLPFADAPESQVALAWPAEETTDLMEQFIGIVRGRTANSTRGRPQEPVKREKTPKVPKAAKVSTRQRTGASRGAGRGKPRRRS